MLRGYILKTIIVPWTRSKLEPSLAGHEFESGPRAVLQEVDHAADDDQHVRLYYTVWYSCRTAWMVLMLMKDEIYKTMEV